MINIPDRENLPMFDVHMSPAPPLTISRPCARPPLIEHPFCLRLTASHRHLTKCQQVSSRLSVYTIYTKYLPLLFLPLIYPPYPESNALGLSTRRLAELNFVSLAFEVETKKGSNSPVGSKTGQTNWVRTTPSRRTGSLLVGPASHCRAAGILPAPLVNRFLGT